MDQNTDQNSGEKLSPEQLRKYRADKREESLHYLNNTQLTDLAAAHWLLKDEGFGKSVEGAVYDHKNRQNMFVSPNPEVLKLQESLYNESRRDEDDPYSGSFDGHNLIERAATIAQKYLNNLTVKDILNLMGTEEKIHPSFSRMYIGDLAEMAKNEENEEVKQVYSQIYGYLSQGIIDHMKDSKASEALATRSEVRKSTLEAILTGPKGAKARPQAPAPGKPKSKKG